MFLFALRVFIIDRNIDDDAEHVPSCADHVDDPAANRFFGLENETDMIFHKAVCEKFKKQADDYERKAAVKAQPQDNQIKQVNIMDA